MAVIGLSGSYGGLNSGDEAIFASIIGEIRRLRPDAEIVVFSRNVEHTRAHYDVDRVLALTQSTRDEMVPEIRRLDLMILGGGGVLYDDLVPLFLREVRLAQQAGVPTFCFAIGAGPLESQEARQSVREVLSRMDGITVREIEAKRLLEEVGIEREIEVTADPALLLTPEPFTDDMLAAAGVPLGAPLVGFSVREPGGAAPGLKESAYHGMVADAADFIVRRFGANIVFVPMEKQDIRHSHQVIAQMLAAERATVLQGEYGPRQILGLVERFDMAVAMRLHLLIFAAIAGVPFLALPYASKVTGFLKKLEHPEQSLIQEGHVGPFLADLDWTWDHREEQRRILAERVPPLQELARRTAQLAMDILGRPARDSVSTQFADRAYSEID